MGIGSNLKRLRAAKGWSQAQLAQASGVSQQLISQIERDVNQSTKELPALAIALGVRPPDIDPAFREAEATVTPAEVPLPSIANLPRDVPVLGTVNTLGATILLLGGYALILWWRRSRTEDSKE